MSRVMGRIAVRVLFAIAAGCAGPVRAPSDVPNARLVDTSGAIVDARSLVLRAPLTTFVFFSAHCHCLDAHDARLRALAEAYTGRGVQFVMVDSEARAARDSDAEEARRRGYHFSIVIDRGAALADALGAEYATYTVVADAGGHVRYRGGIDSDKIGLHEDATFFLRDALDDLLAGRAPRVPEGKTLGCAIAK